jgi:hypothetical protein
LFCFDGRAALVWLDPLEPDHGTGAGVLCARHADALTPPRGWHLQDRRVPMPRLWDERPALPSRPGADANGAARRRAPLREQHAAGDAADVEPLPFDSPPTSVPATPLAELLDARSPLLARAFAAARDS